MKKYSVLGLYKSIAPDKALFKQKIVVFALLQTTELLTILVLTCQPVHFTACSIMCLKSAGCVANSVDPDQMLQHAASDLGLHCLLMPVCPNT